MTGSASGDWRGGNGEAFGGNGEQLLMARGHRFSHSGGRFDNVMKITDIKLHTIKSGHTGARGAAHGESQYWGGGWIAQTLIANPMSVHPKYSCIRSQWMGGGQDPYVIEIFTDGSPLT